MLDRIASPSNTSTHSAAPHLLLSTCCKDRGCRRYGSAIDQTFSGKLQEKGLTTGSVQALDHEEIFVGKNPFFIEGGPSRFTSETGRTNNRPARDPRHRLGGSSDAVWQVKRYGINFTDLDKLVIILLFQSSAPTVAALTTNSSDPEGKKRSNPGVYACNYD